MTVFLWDVDGLVLLQHPVELYQLLDLLLRSLKVAFDLLELVEEVQLDLLGLVQALLEVDDLEVEPLDVLLKLLPYSLRVLELVIQSGIFGIEHIDCGPVLFNCFVQSGDLALQAPILHPKDIVFLLQLQYLLLLKRVLFNIVAESPLGRLDLLLGIILHLDLVVQDRGGSLEALVLNDQVAGIRSILQSEVDRGTANRVLNLLKIFDRLDFGCRVAEGQCSLKTQCNALPSLGQSLLILEFTVRQVRVLLVDQVQIMYTIGALCCGARCDTVGTARCDRARRGCSRLLPLGGRLL